MVGVQELEQEIGPKKTDDWMQKIGKKLAEMEGPGLMGDQLDSLYCFRICLFAPKLTDFIEEMGLPEGHEEIIKYVKSRYDGPGGPAPVNVCCSMCHAYRKKRAQLAGEKDLLHLGAKYKLTGTENINNEELLKEAKYTKAQIKKLLEKYDCISKYI